MHISIILFWYLPVCIYFPNCIASTFYELSVFLISRAVDMKKYLGIAALVTCLSPIGSVYASSETSNLSVCFTDSLNGKERKNLAKWVFLSMTHHETIQPYSKATAIDIDDSNRYIGALMTRLVTEDCPIEFEQAILAGGQGAVKNAFRTMGEVAMQELMTDGRVAASFQGFEKYLDERKISETFQ